MRLNSSSQTAMILNKATVNKMNKLGGRGIPFLFVIDFEASSKSLVLPLADLQNEKHIQFNINGLRNIETTNFLIEKPIFLEKKPMPFPLYEAAFEYCLAQINYGNSYLLNLTFPTPIVLNLTLQEIFKYSQSKYKLLIANHFVSFSPETFLQIKNGIISSNPMKGTIAADFPDAEQAILNNKKEAAEHATIVDLIRNDLNQVAKKIRVEQFRYLDRIMTHTGELIQVSSKISGQLPSNYSAHIGDIFAKILPAGSITGAPKKKTVQIIQTAEGYDRGFYTGIFGYFDGKNLDSAVTIRYIEKINGQLVFKSGGGITHQSTAAEEYQELIDKVYVPFRNH